MLPQAARFGAPNRLAAGVPVEVPAIAGVAVEVPGVAGVPVGVPGVPCGVVIACAIRQKEKYSTCKQKAEKCKYVNVHVPSMASDEA